MKKYRKQMAVIIIGIVMTSTTLSGCAKIKNVIFPKEEADVEQVEFSNDINMDIISRHAYPELERMEENERSDLVDSLQVMRKIDLLGLDKKSFLYPELNLEKVEQTLSSINGMNPEEMNVIDFNGSTSDELQEMIDTTTRTVIDIHSENIKLVHTISLKDDICIRGNGVEFLCDDLEYAFVGEDISNASIENIKIKGNADYGIFFAGGSNISISDCTITNMNQKSLCIVGKATGFKICNNILNENGAGSLYISGDVSDGLIEGNEISNNRGTSNWMAGMVLTCAVSNNKLNIWETFESELHRCAIKENLYGQTLCPHNIIIKNNIVKENNSSGIYSDGSYGCFVINNTIQQNDKEGICLDNGTINFFLKENIIEKNGCRARQTDDDLRLDYVFDAGRTDDGSAKAKLPGVSLDNTAYNILENNIVLNNYGGGIKMVRTTARCLIHENIIKDNNMGQNDIYHFFGIEIGAAVADEEVKDLDFTPSFENIICRNSITGNHYSGVFIGENCYVNDVFDNVIMESQMFAVESIGVKFNSIVNNISSAPIRNEYKEPVDGRK